MVKVYKLLRFFYLENKCSCLLVLHGTVSIFRIIKVTRKCLESVNRYIQMPYFFKSHYGQFNWKREGLKGQI